MSFADVFELKLGETLVRGRRLTIRELRENYSALLEDRLDVPRALELVREHVTLADGGAFDPEDVSMDQMRRLIAEMTLPEEGRGISDFIGLLC
ncbi:MAG: hypothetical protein IKC80_10050 [Kiritimatiellae bacterium]|nr:hypothetical protein [Kiritimatiellia bacterium]